jgi:hypothetical protein
MEALLILFKKKCLCLVQSCCSIHSVNTRWCWFTLKIGLQLPVHVFSVGLSFKNYSTSFLNSGGIKFRIVVFAWSALNVWNVNPCWKVLSSSKDVTSAINTWWALQKSRVSTTTTKPRGHGHPYIGYCWLTTWLRPALPKSRQLAPRVSDCKGSRPALPSFRLEIGQDFQLLLLSPSVPSQWH